MSLGASYTLVRLMKRQFENGFVSYVLFIFS